MSRPANERNAVLVGKYENLRTEAVKVGVTLNAFGSVGILLHCPDSGPYFESFGRVIRDIDVAGLSHQRSAITKLLRTYGYQEDTRYRRLSGGRRLTFFDPSDAVNIDVILDKLRYCQVLDLRSALRPDAATLPVTELLLSKLQRVDLRDEDIFDISVLLHEHRVEQCNENEFIDVTSIAGLCARDWRWWRSVKAALMLLRGRPIGLSWNYDQISSGVDEIEHFIDKQPKSVYWRIRSLLGDRFAWFTEVDELGAAPYSVDSNS